MFLRVFQWGKILLDILNPKVLLICFQRLDGDLVPRKAPKRYGGTKETYDLVYSFAERSKHDKRGFKFGNAKERLVFNINQGPGPSEYKSNLEHKGVNGAIMTLAPCVRLTDVVIKNELKYGIPGITSCQYLFRAGKLRIAITN